MELLDQAPATQHKSFNIKKELGKYLKKWYWIVLSMVVFYTAAKIYLRYIEPLYFTKTTLKFTESKSKGNTTLSDLQTLGTGLSNDSELQSETTAIISKPILTRVVDNLNLNISFFAVGKILEPELYKTSPLTGKLVEVNPDFNGTSYFLTQINNSEYELSEGPLQAGKNRFRYGQIANLPLGKIIIYKTHPATNIKTLKVTIRSTAGIVASLEGMVQVTLPENKGLLMDLSLVGATPKKSEDILNEITKQYNIEDVKDRNEEAQNTQNFITDRLSIISNDLSGIEGAKEHFKKENQITNLDDQANLALSNSNANTKQLVDLSTKLDLVNSIYSASNGDKLIPSNMGLSAQTEGYITEYNDLLIQRNKTLKQASAINPSVIDLNRQIAEVKTLIKQNLLESRETLNIQIAQLQSSLNLDKQKINNYPTQERVFRGIERQQNLKEQLYLYLLQKREENAITLAVTTPKARVLNPAYTTGIVKPNTKQILSIAILAGLALPIAILYLFYFLDNRIYSKKDILAQIPNATVLGEIPQVKDDNTKVQTNDFSLYAESFRILTSNLKYILKSKADKLHNVILVTSSIAKEGKTTIAINIAHTFAGTSKVLLIGADIRNPQFRRFVSEKMKGVTDYLISDDAVVDSYIHPFDDCKNLDVIFSGSLAPNPADLLEMDKFSEMILQLKNQYDYIILDSAPVMLVSDTLHLLRCSDTVLYVTKAGYTDKDMLNYSIEFAKQNHIKRIEYVLNGVKEEHSEYRKRYDDGYNQYYTDNRNESFITKVLKLLHLKA